MCQWNNYVTKGSPTIHIGCFKHKAAYFMQLACTTEQQMIFCACMTLAAQKKNTAHQMTFSRQLWCVAFILQAIFCQSSPQLQHSKQYFLQPKNVKKLFLQIPFGLEII